MNLHTYLLLICFDVCLQNLIILPLLKTGCKRDAVDLLLKASGYLEFCTREILPRIPLDVKYDAQQNVENIGLGFDQINTYIA